MRIKKDFELREVCGDYAVMALDLNIILDLNNSAVWLWKEAEAQGEFTAESLTARVCEEYDVTAEVAQSYVTDFLEELDKEGVIEK